ncbi:MAG TPA: AAA family ATPase [Vicinamibacterales bacterium]|nr:AAA family ATPase [Vicinamibacterales bacterium]
MEPAARPKLQANTLYETFYGLTEQPFAISTDPCFLYMSASHEKAYDELLTGLRRDEALVLLVGEAGTGKTTLCRAVIEALGERTFSCLVLNPYVTGPELLRIVLRDFGLVSREDLRSGALAKADTVQLLDTLEGR